MSQQINLFNPIFLKQKKLFTTVTMARALGVLLLGCALMVVFGYRSVATLEKEALRGEVQLKERQARLAQVNIEFAPRQKSVELAARIAQAEAELHALHEVAGILRRGDLGNTAGYAGYFSALARQNVDGLWLTGVSIVGAGSDIGVQGRALDAALVPGYMHRLGTEAVLQGKAFSHLQISQAMQTREGESRPEPAPYVEFDLRTTPPEEKK